jgi:hypothetical protein
MATVQCAFCSRAFNSQHALNNHWNAVHARSSHNRVSGHNHTFKCSNRDCQKVFQTQGALNDHSRAVHSSHCNCPECGQSFSKKLAFHVRAVHYTPPPITSNGFWTTTQECSQRKSFGFFVCECGSEWISAHAFKKYKQGCKKCEKETFPRKMWQNEQPKNNSEEPLKLDTKKPHDQQRCEACRLGKCLEFRVYNIYI